MVGGTLMWCMAACKTTRSESSATDHTAPDRPTLPRETGTPRNETGEYELRTGTVTPTGRLDVAVVRVRDQKVIWQKNIRAGYAKWAGGTTLEVLDAPGILKKNETLEDYLLKIDIATINTK